MITKRYVMLIKTEEEILRKINEAKECGDHAKIDKMENELFKTSEDIKEENFKMDD